MKVTGQWPRLERVIIGELSLAVPSALWRSELDTQWTEGVTRDLGRVGLVEQPPGQAGAANYDRVAPVQVTLFANSRGDLWSFVQEVEVALWQLEGVDEIEVGAFGVIPYNNPGVRRAVGNHRVTTRPQ